MKTVTSKYSNFLIYIYILYNVLAAKTNILHLCELNEFFRSYKWRVNQILEFGTYCIFLWYISDQLRGGLLVATCEFGTGIIRLFTNVYCGYICLRSNKKFVVRIILVICHIYSIKSSTIVDLLKTKVSLDIRLNKRSRLFLGL